MSNLQLVTQFTDDAIAQEDRLCERNAQRCGRIIRKGEPCIYVASVDSTRPGRFVCATCADHYMTSMSTTARRINPSSRAPPSTDVPSVQAVRQAVSAAQRKATIYPPQVMAVPPAVRPPMPLHAGGAVQRPHVAHSTQPSTGPVVLYPSMQPPNRSASVLSGSSLAPGYGAQHTHWSSSHQYWSSKAYSHVPPAAVPPAETISLGVSALYEGGPSRKNRHGTPFGSISEGKRDVDAQITALGLIALARDLIIPRIKAFAPRFSWRDEEFMVRDEFWVDLAKYNNPTQAYFYKDCFVAGTGRKSKGPMFKTKTFALYVIVPAQQWSEYEVFQEHDAAGIPAPASIQDPSHDGRLSGRVHAPAETGLSGQAAGKLPPLEKPLTIARARAAKALPKSLFLTAESDSRSSNSRSEVDPILMPLDGVRPVAITGKRGHAASVSSVTTKSPPTKRATTSTTEAEITAHDAEAYPPPPIPYSSLDHTRLFHALRSGGDTKLDATKVLKVKRDLIEFYPIPTFSIHEILDDKKKYSFDMQSVVPCSGHMRLDASPDSLIGVGGFKTAQRAALMLSSPRTDGIGSQLYDEIVVKRFYIQPSADKDGKLVADKARLHFTRLSIPDELKRLCREANILYWAKSLLRLTYDFIDRAIVTAPPPFIIPRLRFVDGGILLVVKASNNATKPKGSSTANVIAPYLAEELIPDDGPFVKYVHNSDPVPLPDEDEPGHDLARFLCFTQHIQYVETGGLAYITDYQGSGTLLTDPQILTHPEVSAGRDLFGDGNLEIGVKLFPKEHVCNLFCKWPGFGLADASTIDTE